MIDHGIKSLPEAKALVKNAYPMVPLELAELQKPSKKLLSTRFSRPVQALMEPRNWVQLLNATQFGHSAQTDSLIRRIQFEINGSRHSVLSSFADGSYVGNNPQVHRVEKEWEQMVDIARVCLEEALRPMEEREDRKQCLLEFEQMTNFSINDATMSPMREIHKLLVKWKNLIEEVTSRERVEDLEAWKQKTEELQLRQLTGTPSV
ncbi:mannose-P-dolichol utilization defect 1 protein-like protein 2-like [Cucumis melo var. makuwa]|uniref:Mannose-P-dolichol utilization defect 1 protein-like protein 2-like n=1 Tax=Cucumis melo var. makuwa TaxID=1194695 RepID=A0A5D3CRX2_CUCMM|nr:mannose-P-dolichol utilization defect 1 protein-like protein 2-like [Cucumis melo var. makuwa]